MSAKKKRKKAHLFVARVPIPVRGGLHAQISRTQKSRKWWAASWLTFMEELHMGARIGRGRAYALSGQVMSLSVGTGRCESLVQGASREPYSCVLSFDVPDDAMKKSIIGRLRSRPLTLAQLLVRNLPRSVDRIFRASGYPLVPTGDNSFEATCSCPDYSPLCKHIAATLFLLTEAIEQDPLLLLSLRGISRAELLATNQNEPDTAQDMVSGLSGDMVPGSPDGTGTGNSEGDDVEFWGKEPEAPEDYGAIPAMSGKAVLARRLGSIPFWRGEERFLEAMDLCASRSALAGWRVWAAEPPVRITAVKPSSPPSMRHSRIRTAILDEL